MSTVADYAGRTVDVAAFHGLKPSGDVLLQQSLAMPGTGGEILTGIVKLGQRFLLELLTEYGSMPYQPTRGSTLLTELRQGFVRNQVDLFAAFNRALLDVQRSLVAEESATDPADERYGGCDVLGVELRPGWASVSVSVSSLDPNAVAILPISLTV